MADRRGVAGHGDDRRDRLFGNCLSPSAVGVVRKRQSRRRDSRRPGRSGKRTPASAANDFPESLVNAHPAPGWQFWHEANWHSFLEQSYGFINGVGVIVGMAFLVRRIGPLRTTRPSGNYWPEIVAVTLGVPALLYVNLVKNVADWTA